MIQAGCRLEEVVSATRPFAAKPQDLYERYARLRASGRSRHPTDIV